MVRVTPISCVWENLIGGRELLLKKWDIVQSAGVEMEGTCPQIALILFMG